MADITFGSEIQCNENAHEAWKSLIYKYDVSDDKQKRLNEVTNIWNYVRIKDTSQDPDIWSNELYKLNLKINKIKYKYEIDGDEI